MDVASLTGFRDLSRPHGLKSLQWINKPHPWRLSAPLAVFGETDANRSRVDEAFRLSRTVNAAGTAIAQIDCAIVAPNGLVFTSKQQLVYESVFPWQLENYETEFASTLDRVSNVSEGNEERRSCAYYAREPSETGYFHFINSIVPRLAVREYLEPAPDVMFNIYRPFAKELQERLGLAASAAKPWTHVDKLYLPTPFTVQGDHFTRPPFGTKLIQDLLARTFPGETGKPRRLFLSRSDADVRRLVGESEFAAKLQKRYGFESVTTTGLTLAQQAEMFRNAEALVSVHGAGLSNMVFMRPGALVVEIVSPSRLWPTFRCLAARCELRYAAIIGRQVVADSARADGNEDFEADGVALDRCMRYVMSQ